VVISHLPRKSLFYSKKKRLIAANVDAIIIVTAPLPIFSEYMIDRYLVAAENLQIRPVILLNKIDLLNGQNRKYIEEKLAEYEKLGYTVLFSSALFTESLTDLDKFLHDKTAVLVGASGVGKSSIIRALTSHPDARVGDTSALGLGKHTTTVARLYHLVHGGNLIDSPGVREFGLWNIDKENVMQGFVEFSGYLNQCKFRNCTHQQEPGCAILAALENGEISPQRFESYEKILAELGKESRY
jgi:ribosome biogenesis GTPase